ncbi:MAG: hypothetical protein SFY32_02240 [Bacteroidota bacterium]|nr:hypothetical protein [Bacteroidota bacterium]
MKLISKLILLIFIVSSCSLIIRRNCQKRTDGYYGYSDKARTHKASGAPIR